MIHRIYYRYPFWSLFLGNNPFVWTYCWRGKAHDCVQQSEMIEKKGFKTKIICQEFLPVDSWHLYIWEL
jgi:hypothetical protein